MGNFPCCFSIAAFLVQISKPFQRIQYQVTAGVRSINDASCTDRVADIDDFRICTLKPFCNRVPDWCVCLHSQAYESIIKVQLLLFAIVFYQEGMRIYFHQRGVRHLSDLVLLHTFFR